MRPGELARSASIDTGAGILNLTDLPGEPFFTAAFFWIVFFGGGAGLVGGAFLAGGAFLTGADFCGGAFLTGAFFGGGAAFFSGALLGGF